MQQKKVNQCTLITMQQIDQNISTKPIMEAYSEDLELM